MASTTVAAPKSRAERANISRDFPSCDPCQELTGRSAPEGLRLSVGSNDGNLAGNEEPRVIITSLHASLPRPRVRLLYNDEGVRERFCSNAQFLLQTALQDPQANSKSAQLARKALRYRNIMSRTESVDLEDPKFDISAFFGVKWQRDDILGAQ